MLDDVHLSISAYVCTYVRPSTNSRFDFNEIWHVGSGRWVMHDGMQYDPIQGQDQGHEPFKVRNLAIFKSYLFHRLQRKLTVSKLVCPWDVP